MKMRVRVAWSDSADAVLMRLAGLSAVVHVTALIVFSFLPRFFTPAAPPRATIAEIIPASALLPGGGRQEDKPAPPKGPTPRERAEAARRAADEAKAPPKVKPPEKEKTPPKDKTVPPLEKPKQKKQPERAPDPPPAEAPDVAPAEKETPAESASSPAEAAAPRSIDGISFGTGSGGGVPGIGSAAFPYDYYRSALRSILQSHWRRPVTPEGLAETVTCEVRFAILRTGIIQDIQIARPSGNAILDQSAMRAVYDSNPLPPLPAQYGQALVMADVVFELTPE